MQGRLEVLFLAQLHHRTDGNPFCPTIHALYHFVVPSAIRTMDGLLSEVVSLKALMSFWTFISMSKNSQAEPDAMAGSRKAWRWRAPRGRQPSYESELEYKSRGLWGYLNTCQHLFLKIINIRLRIIATDLQNHYGLSQLTQCVRFWAVCLRVGASELRKL